MPSLKIILQVTSTGQFAIPAESVPWLIPEVGECARELMAGHPVIMDLYTWRAHDRRPLPDSTVLLIDELTTSIEVGENTQICPSIDSAINCSKLTANELGVSDVFVFGDHVILDRLLFRANQVLTIEIAGNEFGDGCMLPNLSHGFIVTDRGEWMTSSAGCDFRIVEWTRRH